MKIADVIKHEDFIFAFNTFLDDFQQSENKYSLIADAPTDGKGLFQAILAAAVQKLSNDYKIAAPAWVNDSRYIMPVPVFAFNTENIEYQTVLKESTPPEFASRNLFFGANVMERI